MLRVAILGLAASITWASAIFSQQLRTERGQFGLAGNVQSVETSAATVSTKSYKLRSGGREELEDFEGASDLTLVEFYKFDSQGKLVEDIDRERTMDQDSYRYTYVYNPRGLLVEQAGYREDGSADGKTVYVYGSEGAKTEELYYSRDGRLLVRTEFDDHGNAASIESYGTNGQASQKEIHRYEYTRHGNTVEQIYYPPERPAGTGLVLLQVPDGMKSTEVARPVRFRTVIIQDDLGRVREQCSYDPDGSLLEKTTFDQNGILKSKEWHLGDLAATTTEYDVKGRELKSHTTGKPESPSQTAFDELNLSSYDEHGNETEVITKGPNGTILRRTANVYEYDALGNWINKTETELNNTWQTEPFPAAREAIRRYHRTISYFP